MAPLPSIADLARIATDAEPDAADFAPALVLGPLADEADRYTLLVATAWGATMVAEGADRSPLVRFAKDKAFSRSVRAAMRAVLAALAEPWSLVASDGVHAELAHLVGSMGSVGSVRWRTPATPFGPPRPGCGVLTAIGRGPEGWEMVAPIVVPGVGAGDLAGYDGDLVSLTRRVVTGWWARG